MNNTKKYYGKYKSEIGTLKIVANDFGIDEITIDESDFIETKNDVIILCKKQLDEYFTYNRLIFDLPLNFYKSELSKQVYKTLVGVEDTVSYSELGELAGVRSGRVVGSYMKNNKHMIVVPCHRVIKKDQTLGGFFYDSSMKMKLLEIDEKNRENIAKRNK